MRVLVTGSSGLIGSEAVRFFDALGFDVTGVDNNMRADFFGPKGDTTLEPRAVGNPNADSSRITSSTFAIGPRSMTLSKTAATS